jgi:hypothetical protein
VETKVAVVHLVRVGSSPDATRRFLGSYLAHPAGSAHRLVLLLKGFDAALPTDICRLLEKVPHSELRCPDKGYDIASYFYAAKHIAEPLVVFTNTYSVLQGDQWLSKLLNAFQRDGVGLVGATGSWESIALDSSRGIFSKVISLALTSPLRVLFPGFPNAHVRTNGFLLAREDFMALRSSFMPTKLGAWMFESGRNSMTRQIQKRGLEVLVVGRDGTAYRPREWPGSRTFWQSSQENLLIQDNRTMAYEKGDADSKARKFTAAWNFSANRRLFGKTQ